MARGHRHHRKLTIKQLLLISIVVSFGAAAIFPGVGQNNTIQNSITFLGILFGIIVGFFIADLYTRYSSIRSSAAQDSSCLSTFYLYAKILAQETDNHYWLHKVEDRLERYIHTFMPLPWEHYDKTEADFAEIGKSMQELKYSNNDKANEVWSNMLNLYNQHSTARENLVMYGEDKLSWGEWATSLMLGGLLLASLFYVKDSSLTSTLFTGALTSAILILFIVLRDLDNLNFGEEQVSIEPYERVLDAIGRPRYFNDSGKSTSN